MFVLLTVKIGYVAKALNVRNRYYFMVRYLPIGNSRVLVSFDKDYRIVDFYYAHDQSDNHAVGHPFRFGVSINDHFRWIDHSLITSMDYLDDTMIGNLKYQIDQLKFENLDFVDIYQDIYVRKINIFNESNAPQEIKFFFHHDFYIYGNDIGDTAFYYPELNSVIHYKGSRYFLAATLDDLNNTNDQYAIGIKAFRGFEGTWKDAEDSILSFNPVAIGSVDSVISNTIIIQPYETRIVYYFIICGENMDEIIKDKNHISIDQLKEMYRQTNNYWEVWSAKKKIAVNSDIVSLFKKSQFIIRTHINNIGGIMASSDSDILKDSRDGYYYVWPRDAALAAYALTKTLHFSASRRFFDFALGTVSKDGYFYHKYMANGKIASSWIPRVMDNEPILPIQEDETALVIWALWQYYLQSLDIEYFFPFYDNLIKKSADFLVKFTDENGLPKSSYDLWEERYGVHTFTVSTTYAGLKAAANFAKTFGDFELVEKYNATAKRMAESFEKYFYSEEKGYYARALIKNVPDFTVDSQNMALFLFDMKDVKDPRMQSNMNIILQKLWVKNVGGLARYENDMYQRTREDSHIPGNPWIITTLWAARYFIRMKEINKAEELIKWVLDHKQNSGVLSEQINPYDNTVLSVSPLIWSHAEFILTVLEYTDAK